MKIISPIPPLAFRHIYEAIYLKHRASESDLWLITAWIDLKPDVHGEITPDNPKGEWWKRFSVNGVTRFFLTGRGDCPTTILASHQIPHGKEILESLSVRLLRFLLCE